MTAVSGYVEHFRARVLQDALNEATAAYWRRRAETFRWAATPRPGDHPGNAITPAERLARRRRLLRIAEACELKAQVALYGGELDPDVVAILREVA